MDWKEQSTGKDNAGQFHWELVTCLAMGVRAWPSFARRGQALQAFLLQFG
jgi:hypothetical protein